jgi:hypothetical protein
MTTNLEKAPTLVSTQTVAEEVRLPVPKNENSLAQINAPVASLKNK